MSTETHPSISVCFIASVYHPIFGGAARRFQRYMPGMLQRNIQMQVIAPRHDTLAVDETIEGINVHRVDVNHPSQLVAAAYDYFTQTGNWPDVIAAMVPFRLSILPAMFQFRRRGIGCILIVTMVSETSVSLSIRLKRFISAMLGMLAIHRVIASTSAMRDWLVGQGFMAQMIDIIPNGVDLDQYRPAASKDEKRALRLKLGMAPDHPALLFVGVFHKRKGLDYLAHAWDIIASKHSTVELYLIAPRLDEQTDEEQAFNQQIEDHLQTSPYHLRVHLMGQKDNVDEYMRAADIFIFPSRQEGMGNVILEALASGLPVVTTPFIGLPEEFGRNGETYELASFDSNIIAERVLGLLDDPERRQTLARAARQHVEKHLSVEYCLDTLAEVYRDRWR